MNLLTKQKETQTLKMNLWLLGGKDSQGFREAHVHTALFKMGN